MKLNHNSFSAKLYRWFYGTSDMPSNLCPYFWKLVTAVIFGLPVLLITAPHLLIYKDNDSRDSFGERIGVGLITWFILFMAVAMLSVFSLFWVIPAKDSAFMHMVTTGFLGWILSIIFGGIALYKWLKEKHENALYRKRNYDKNGNWIPIDERVKEEKSNIVVEMVKAKYNKYCPKIDWN